MSHKIRTKRSPRAGVGVGVQGPKLFQHSRPKTAFQNILPPRVWCGLFLVSLVHLFLEDCVGLTEPPRLILFHYPLQSSYSTPTDFLAPPVSTIA